MPKKVGPGAWTGDEVPNPRDPVKSWRERSREGILPGKEIKGTAKPRIPQYIEIAKKAKLLGVLAGGLPEGHPLKGDIQAYSQMIQPSLAIRIQKRRETQATKPMRLYPGGHLGMADPNYPPEGSLAEQAIKERGLKEGLRNRFQRFLSPKAAYATWDEIASALNTYFAKALRGV